MYIEGVEQKRGILFVDDNFALLEKISPSDERFPDENRDFYFKFYLKVSQTKVIEENAFSVIVSVKTANKQIPVIIPNYQDSKIDSNKIVENILTNKLRIKKQNLNQESSILVEKVADITSKLDNKFLTSLKSNLVDEFQFSKTKVLVRKKKDVEDINIDQSLDRSSKISSTRSLFGELSELKSETKSDFISIKNRLALLNVSIPPSAITSTSNKTMTPQGALTGCILPLPKDNFRNSLIDSLSFFHHLEDIDDEERKKNKNIYETVIDQSFDDLINVNLNVTLSESYMYQPYLIAEFKLVKSVVNSRNQVQQIVVETIEKKFDMKYYFDNFISNMRPLPVGVSKRNQEVFLQVRNPYDTAYVADVYVKHIKNFNESSFYKVSSAALSSKNQISVIKAIDFDCDSIYRVVPTDMRTKRSSNDFTDVVVKNPRKIYNVDVIVIPFLSKGKINLQIVNNSYNFSIVSCKILYRNLTKKERNYTLESILSFDQNRKEYSYVMSSNFIPYNTYEITTKLIFENGVEIYSSNSNSIQFIPFHGTVPTEISNISVGSDITFDISAMLLEDQAAQITRLLGETSATYDREYYLSKKAEFDKFVSYQIYRYNLSSGICEDLGIITNNSTFSDSTQSTAKKASEAFPNAKYKYVIYPLIRDPETVTEVKKEFIDVETKKRYFSNLRKSRHPLALMRGSILSKSRIDNDVVPDMLYGMVGDSYFVDVTFGGEQLPSIQNFSANLFNNKKVMLTWSIVGNQKRFDHILIFKDEDGIRTIVGKTHCFKSDFTFMYDLTNHDIGNIRFILVPIHQDYSSGKSVISNYILVNDVE